MDGMQEMRFRGRTMSQIHVYALESIIPIKRISDTDSVWVQNDKIEMTSYSKIETQFNIASETSNGGLDWVEANKELGNKGEKVALSYLRGEYEKVTLVSDNARLGYDIEVVCEKTGSKMGFEVKTSTTENRFFISINELSKAYEMEEKYYIFFLQVKDDSDDCYGYIIQNPIRSLQLDFNEVIKPTQTNNIKIVPSNFNIELSKEYMRNLSKLSLKTDN